jgi:hypothetical protein
MGAAVKQRTIVLPRETAETRRARIARIAAFLGQLPIDRPWELLVQPFRRSRSSQQNRALWGLAYKMISEATGYELEELHDYYLGTHFGWTVKTVFGQKKRVPNKRSSKLSTVEFAEFFDFIQRHAAQHLGLFIPDPDPNWFPQQDREAA